LETGNRTSQQSVHKSVDELGGEKERWLRCRFERWEKYQQS
jgi:hypothetical protein